MVIVVWYQLVGEAKLPILVAANGEDLAVVGEKHHVVCTDSHILKSLRQLDAFRNTIDYLPIS